MNLSSPRPVRERRRARPGVGSWLAFAAGMLADLPFNTLTHNIISAAIEVHRDVGQGLLINFNVPKLVDGVKRIINPDLR